MLRKTTQDFIDRATLVHGGFYSYNKTIYTKGAEKVVITCPLHGDFQQTASNHLSGNGCPGCKREKARERLLGNLEDFMHRSKERYGDKFDYSEAHYGGASTPLILRCQEHGTITVTPQFHLSSAFGCHKCGIEHRGFVKRNKTEAFIEEAVSVHGDNFDYTETDYKTAKTKIEIFCKRHGYFKTIPYNHLKTKSGGCPLCKEIVFSKINLKDTDYFIERAILVHGNKYDYSNSEYAKATLPVEIICPKHGVFFQTPNSHTSGKGCQICGNAITPSLHSPWWNPEVYSSRFKRTHLYLVEIESKTSGERFYKIGISIRPTRRFSEISNDSKGEYQVKPVTIVEGESLQILESERTLLSLLSDLKYTPVFEFCGRSECFEKSGKVIQMLNDHIKDRYTEVTPEEQENDRRNRTV